MSHATSSKASWVAWVRYSTASAVRRMYASSSEARCGVSSCSTSRWPAASCADALGGEAAHLEHAALRALDLDAVARRAASRSAVACGERTSTAESAEAWRDDLLDGRVGDHAAAADDHQVLGDQRHLAHQMRGEEHGPALAGELLEQRPDPEDALGVEAVGRLVEDDRLRVPEQRGGDPEPLAHAEREAAGALARHAGEPDQVDHLVDARAADAVGLRHRQQVVVGRPPGVDRARLEHRPDLVHRRPELAVGPAVDADARRCQARRGRRSSASSSTCPRRWARGTP